MVQIEYFGPSKDFTNKSIETIKINSLTQLYNHLAQEYSHEFETYVKEHCGITLDFEYIDKESGEVSFEQDSEICIIPPVSSG